MRRRAQFAFAGVLLACVVGAGIWLWPEPSKSKVERSSGTVHYSTDNPSESKTAADHYKWTGAADEPKKIRIAKIGVDAYAQKVGVDQHQAVAVPNNVHLAGWFANGQKPGQKGLAVIDGHVSGRTTDGVFKNLGKLVVGDKIEIELGNGSLKRYVVFATKQVKAEKAAASLFSQNPKVASQLNLITCGGEFDDAGNQFVDRIIVSAKLL